MIVLDTNVLSEGLRPQPSEKVLRWMQSEPITALFTTTITEAELLYGAALLPDGRRRRALEQVVTQLLGARFGGRILPFDSAGAGIRRYRREAARWRAAHRRSRRAHCGDCPLPRRQPSYSRCQRLLSTHGPERAI